MLLNLTVLSSLQRESAMTKLENGGREGRGILGGSPGRVLFKTSMLTAASFLVHILFLFLVSPLNVVHLSKEDAYLYAAIPLCFGALFFALSVYNFIIMEERSPSHILLLLVALSFGSMSLQGLLGLALHYVKPWMESA
jgi:hypothetical protein